MAPQKITLSLKSLGPYWWFLYECTCIQTQDFEIWGEIFKGLWENFFPLKKEAHGKMVSFFIGTLCVFLQYLILLQLPCSVLRCFIPSGKPTMRKAELSTRRRRVLDDVIEPLIQPTLEPAVSLDLLHGG